MKFSYSLIKRLVPGVPDKLKLAEALNLHTAEVEGVEGDTLHIALPANRYSDVASHIGIAREATAIFNLKFSDPVVRIVNPPTDKGFLVVEVKNENLCLRYAARYFALRGVDDSPAWMQKILHDCGLKPINYIVDCMNFVMLETGQPLHAFDADRIKSARAKSEAPNPIRILIRLAKSGEKIRTLDGQHMLLENNTLVVADSERPHAIAGIKGGADSGITKRTKRIIVEAANFDPVHIYHTSRHLKLMTDASLRFSHGMSPELVGIGMDRATALLAKARATLLDSADVYQRPVKDEVIAFDTEKYAAFIGESVTPRHVKKIFEQLGFSVAPHATYAKRMTETRVGRAPRAMYRDDVSFLVRVPAWRTDIQNFEDLAEEVARLSGYEKIAPAAPSVSLVNSHEDDVITLKEKARRVLVGLQLDEVYNYAFVSEEEAKEKSFFGYKAIPLRNPIRREYAYLRASLKPRIIRNLYENTRVAVAQSDRSALFEIGTVYGRGRQEEIEERLFLGIGLAAKNDPEVVLELKGIVDGFLQGIGLMEYFLTDVGGTLRIVSGRHILGYLESSSHNTKKWYAAFSEIDLTALLSLVEREREFAPLAKYPAIIRDISIRVNREVRIGSLLDRIQTTSPRLIENVDVVDIYVDESFRGEQSITFRIVFQAEDRTLTDKEVDQEMKKITAALAREWNVEVR